MNRPNILILLSDQLRRQALGCYGDPDARTPNRDGLARDGVRFTAANATYPVCVPFRFTLMTGEYAHSRLVPAIEWAMSPAERTLADEFNERDYETVYIGKWHLDGGHGRMGSAQQCGMTPVRRTQQGRWQKWFGFELRNDPFDTYYFVDEPTCAEDLFPTLLGLAGLTPRNPLPGRDLTPLMHGKQEKLDRQGVLLQLVAEHRKGFPFYEEVWRGLRTRRYKYTVKGDKFGGKPWQFYDLERDPFECENLIEHPEFQEEIARHHCRLVQRLWETSDRFVLLPAFGCEGVNMWNVE